LSIDREGGPVRRGKIVLGTSAVTVAAAVAVAGFVIRSNDRHPFPVERPTSDASVRRGQDATVYNASANVLFEVASATLDPQAIPALRHISDDIVKSHPSGIVQVEGYTDDAGTDDYNYDLSQRRAESVGRWLVANAGIDGSRIKIVAYGETHPVQGNDTDAQRKANRRVVIAVAK
jgi:outer membrane protein OmpA-like peptidoglycan-associated protein